MAFEKTKAVGYLKDPKTGLVVNTNIGEYEQIIEARKKRHEQQSLARDVENLKKDIGDIKSMLMQIMGRVGN